MQFVLMGFDQDGGVRRYAFQGIVDRVRTDFSVHVDLKLIAAYGIRIQDLPLLCRGLLERRTGEEEQRTVTLTEDEMRVYADGCAAAREAAELRKKAPRRPPAENLGAAWRNQPR